MRSTIRDTRGNVSISGRVSAAGVILSGIRYTVIKSAAGVYDITFLDEFKMPPKIVVSVSSSTTNLAVAVDPTAGPATKGCQVRTFTAGAGTLTDTAFTFSATE